MMKRNMADMAGRAMKGRADDKMGRAMAAPRPVRGGVMAAKKGGMMKSNGGSASKRADGVASKGKTKGKMVKMAYGGKC